MTNVNRARRNAGKKAGSAQSATAPKSSPGKTPEDAVWIQLIDVQGNMHPDLKIPKALYNSLLACAPGQSSAGQPVAELPPCSAILHPVSPTSRKSVATMIELSDDVVKFIEKVAGDPSVKFSAAFHRVVLNGMSALASETNVKEAHMRLCGAFSEIDGIHQEMNFFVQSVRVAMATWNDEGQDTKENREDMQVGFMRLWDRLDAAAREHTRAAREASRQSRYRSSAAPEKGGAR